MHKQGLIIRSFILIIEVILKPQLKMWLAQEKNSSSVIATWILHLHINNGGSPLNPHLDTKPSGSLQRRPAELLPHDASSSVWQLPEVAALSHAHTLTHTHTSGLSNNISSQTLSPNAWNHRRNRLVIFWCCKFHLSFTASWLIEESRSLAGHSHTHTNTHTALSLYALH